MHTKVRKRSQSAGPGKFDKKIGKEESFDQVGGRVAGLGRLSAGAKKAMKPFVKCVITIFATNASFLRIISNFRF